MGCCDTRKDTEEIPEDGVLEPLRNDWVEIWMAKSTEETKTLMEVYPLLEDQNYRVQVTMGILGVPWKVKKAIMDTEASPNLICTEAVPQCCTEGFRRMKTRRLCSAPDTPLQVMESIKLFMQLGHQVTKIGFLCVKNFAATVLWVTVFINKNVRSIHRNEESFYILVPIPLP